MLGCSVLRNFEKIEDFGTTNIGQADRKPNCIFPQIRKEFTFLIAPLYRDKFLPVISIAHGWENANHSV